MTFLLTAAILSTAPQLGAVVNTRLKIEIEPLVCSATVNAPVAKVWEAYTTRKGIESWMVSTGTVDLRIGGKYRTSYQKNSDLKGGDVIENTILAYDPERMLTMRNTKAPKQFPLAPALQKLWTILYFDSLDDTHTKVTCRMLGFTTDADSQKCKAFFRSGNQQELDELVKKFANGAGNDAGR